MGALQIVDVFHDLTGTASWSDPRIRRLVEQSGSDLGVDVDAYGEECRETKGRPNTHLLTAKVLERAGVQSDYFNII